MARSKNGHRTASALAQQERQSTKQVTKSQSLTLVKNLVRVSISTVCHIRNIFPSSCFQERSYAGMPIYQLDAASRDAATNETVVRNDQAYMLTQWIEFGVFEAIERRYLRRMEFIIVSPELNLPRESYSFEIDYPEGGNDEDMTFSGTKVTSVESTKGQLVKLIRSLIQFSNTLEGIPSERIINMKLWYFDERTPRDWEPKHFASADPSELCFNREGDHDSLRIRIGELRTPHHTLKVRFKGIDTTADAEANTTEGEGRGEEGAAADEGIDVAESDNSDDADETCDDVMATRRSKLGNLLTCEAGPEEDNCDDDDGSDDEDEEETQFEGNSTPLAAASGISKISGMMTQLDVLANSPQNTDADESIATRGMDAARDWALRQAKPTITGLMSHLDLVRDRAKGFMNQMVQEGVLTKDSNYRYHLVNPPISGPAKEAVWRKTDKEGPMDTEHDHYSPSQSSSMSDDSATQAPEDIATLEETRTTPSLMPPPPAPGRRARSLGVIHEARRLGRNGEYATPPVPTSTTRPDLQPVPGKPQQARIVSMGTKRVLDEAELLKDDETQQQSDPIDMFNPPMGTIDSMSSLGYEISLSQASSATVSSRTRKCSLAMDPIRQSGPIKKLRMNGSSQRRE